MLINATNNNNDFTHFFVHKRHENPQFLKNSKPHALTTS